MKDYVILAIGIVAFVTGLLLQAIAYNEHSENWMLVCTAISISGFIGMVDAWVKVGKEFMKNINKTKHNKR